jgi:hypothetical protein
VLDKGETVAWVTCEEEYQLISPWGPCARGRHVARLADGRFGRMIAAAC